MGTAKNPAFQIVCVHIFLLYRDDIRIHANLPEKYQDSHWVIDQYGSPKLKYPISLNHSIQFDYTLNLSNFVAKRHCTA